LCGCAAQTLIKYILHAYVSSKFSKIAGSVSLVQRTGTARDDRIVGNVGMGGQGILPIPVVYNGWVQKLPAVWKNLLTASQLNPYP
jgi:hypothetical protein